MVKYPQSNPCQSSGGPPINPSSFFGFPCPLDLDNIEIHEQRIIVHLYATSPTAACPQCGTAGSRVHSRDPRTITDVAFGGRSLVLKLLVRKWICPEASCSRKLFAERFPGLVQRYARMTDRLVKLLQAVGVMTNGADAAEEFSIPSRFDTKVRDVFHPFCCLQQVELTCKLSALSRAGVDERASQRAFVFFWCACFIFSRITPGAGEPFHFAIGHSIDN